MINNQTVIQETLPAIILRGLVPLPNNEIRVDVSKVEDQKAIKAALEGNKFVVLLVPKSIKTKEPEVKDLNEIGIVAKVVYNMDTSPVHKLKVLGVTRCRILRYETLNPYYIVNILTIPTISEAPHEEVATVRLLVEELDRNGQRLFNNNPELINKITSGVTADILTDLLAYNLVMDYNNKMKYLNTSNIGERMKMMLEDIKREKYIQTLEDEIEKEVKKNISENQKEYYNFVQLQTFES